DTVLLKLGNPVNMIWYPTSPAYDAAKDKTYTFDLDKAKALVQKSGVSNPVFDFNYSTAVPEVAQMAQIIQGDLAKVGVSVNLKGQDPAALAGIQYTAKYNGAAFGTALFGQVQPGVQFGSPYYGPLNNWSGFKDDQFTKLAGDMATATDPAKQKQAAAAYTDYVLDQSFTIAICSLLPRVATAAKVHGVAYDMAYILQATEAWIG
ncbi:MAG: hypothetical protein JO247_00265, partial [Chloroflexi bacterium]|nr:hypothetical protein [Chloroflexota bacterium]